MSGYNAPIDRVYRQPGHMDYPTATVPRNYHYGPPGAYDDYRSGPPSEAYASLNRGARMDDRYRCVLLRSCSQERDCVPAMCRCKFIGLLKRWMLVFLLLLNFLILSITLYLLSDLWMAIGHWTLATVSTAGLSWTHTLPSRRLDVWAVPWRFLACSDLFQSPMAWRMTRGVWDTMSQIMVWGPLCTTAPCPG